MPAKNIHFTAKITLLQHIKWEISKSDVLTATKYKNSKKSTCCSKIDSIAANKLKSAAKIMTIAV